MGPLTNITRYIPHIIQLKFSANYTHHITTKIGLQNYIIPTQGSTSFSLWAKPKESPNSLKSHYDVANSKSYYDVANSMSYYDVANSKSYYDVANLMSYYDVANSKPAMMRHYLQSPLLHGISKAQYDPASLKARYDPPPLKAHCYTTPFTKPVATQQYFTKSQNHFHKAQILIWHYSTKPK